MNISEQEIEQLYQFTRVHFVEHYDVQTELVDHLANDIEAIWIENPSLSFDQARDKSFKKFGVFGFMTVVEEKQKQMSKKYWRMVWLVFKGFFRVPQIIITSTICLGLFSLLQAVAQEWVYIVIGFGGIFLMFIRALRVKRKMKLRFQQTQKKWMLEEHVNGFGNFIGTFNLFIQIGIFIDTISSIGLIFLMALFLTLVSLVMYITAYVLPVRVEEILENEYPEYRSVTI